jgi:integrase
MNRRSKGEGNIRLRADGRYEARLGSGNKSKSIFGKTRKEVTEKLNKLKYDLQRGLPLPQDERQTVEQYLTAWLDSKKTTLEPTTFKRYAEVLRLYVYPKLGSIPLTKLTAQQIQALYTQVLDLGRAQNTVNKIHIALHKALQDALRMDLVSRNVADFVDKPKTEPRQEMKTYTPTQLNQLWEAASEDKLEALYILLPTTGCRLGELLGLRWECVDLARGEIRVTAAMKDMAGKQWLDTPKTARSRRTIPLTAMAVEALQRHQLQQKVIGMAHGPQWNPLGLVFCTGAGNALSQTNFRKRYYIPMLEKAGLPYIRPHDQRHTNASVQLDQGTPLHVVSAMLGHASPVTTLNAYSHLMPGQREEARDTLDLLFGTNPGK